MLLQPDCSSRRLLTFALSLLASVCLAAPTRAQDTVTGAFEGRITNSQTGAPIAGASVQFINQATGVPIAKRTNQDGGFYQGLLQPGTYIIRATAPGYKTAEVERRLLATQNNRVIPVPITLDPETVSTTTTTTTTTTTPTTTTTSTTATTTSAAQQDEGEDIQALAINQTDARRGGAFTEGEVSTLPLGATTLVRSFDELALLLPGVALPPQTQGSVAGPGIGAGVGSAGQFAVNGLRSRANNFTVDGSDNNDEDIGVRRQGFFSLIPQPVESIREFQVITLLAPAQFGRNIGAQVNAISKSGGRGTHGTIYGFLNSSQLNSRNVFDTTNGNALSSLRAGNNQQVRINGAPAFVLNESGGEDSFTLGQGGFVIGGPLEPERGPGQPPRMFYFLSAEGQILNASKEASFAVPTVAQRGLFNSGATGLTFTPFPDINGVFLPGEDNAFFPTTLSGDVLFSYFPFPNNPNGIYDANTYTQVLPASAQGRVVSGKFDSNFKVRERAQSFVARYNLTQDWREIPVTGNALYSTLRPRVRTQNFSTFLNSELSGPNSTKPIFNQVRLSYGRTRLNFEEVPTRRLQGLAGSLPTGFTFSNPEDARFLLNARVIANATLPEDFGVPNSGPVDYFTLGNGLTTEDFIGPVGQINIAGFSPVGVDVFNFPQRRVNNTYQLADTLSMRIGNHSFVVGADIRRTELNSDLPRNSRPLITVNGAPRLTATPVIDPNTGDVIGFTNFGLSNNFISATDLAAAGATSGFFQTLSTRDSNINLRYYQLNFFGQDEWRITRNFSLSYGLRYEYNTPPRELNQSIESTFSSSLLSLVPGLSRFIDGRTEIFDPDRNNFAPRIGFAYSPKPFGAERATVIRAGYGLFYDQVLGAVVSQSRNVFPNFITTNFAGGGFGNQFGVLSEPFNPSVFVEPGTINTLNRILSPELAVALFGFISGRGTGTFGATLPARKLEMPMAHHYSVTFEQQLGANMVVSAAYVGTLGRNLLRFTTPNLGPNEFLLPLAIDALDFQPTIFGFALSPGRRVTPAGTLTGGRPFSGVGVVNIFETTGRSRYDALQLQMRGRFARALQYQVAYTFSKAEDDVSDVFDLAGSSALPQNSQTFAGEYAPSNYDARHRFSYNFIYDFPTFRDRGRAFRAFFGDFQIASTGQFQTGQPFTVNSIYDVNLDGNPTDRLNSTTGIVQTGNRAQPLQFTGANTFSLLAPVGQDGSVGRNTFRAGNLLDLNLAVVKKFSFSEQRNIMFRMDIFNFINRANYGIPVRFLESPGFGRATETITPGRRIQFALKFNF